MTEVIALIAFFVLMGLLVSRMRREQHEHAVPAEGSRSQEFIGN